MVDKKTESPPEEEMPEYQMFPRGMWHMLGAIMLMVFSMAGVVILASRIAAPFFTAEMLSYVSLAVMVLMAFILSTPTFFLARGWSRCQRFLFHLNAFYLFALAVGIGFFWLRGTYGLALIGVVGGSCALAARFIYLSEPYRAAVEHYRLIWAHYRAGTNKVK